jgi:hypothetical protein
MKGLGTTVVVLAIVVAAIMFVGVLWQGRRQERSGKTCPACAKAGG